MTYDEVAKQLVCTVRSKNGTATATTNDNITIEVDKDIKIDDIFNVSIYKTFEDETVFIGRVLGIGENNLSDVLKKIDKSKISLTTGRKIMNDDQYKHDMANVINSLYDKKYCISFL